MWSKAWKDFDLVLVNGVRKAECKYCHKKLSAVQGNGTSHLLSHLLICPAKNEDGEILLGLLGRRKRKLDIGSSTYDPEISRRELAYMIILHEFPLSIVDYVGVRRFASSLNPAFNMVSRNTIKDDIVSIHEEGKAKVMNELERTSSKVALTTDMWTSTNKKKGFMVITAHFIDDNWILQSRILRFLYVPAPHTKDVICEVLFECLIEWDIDRKLSTVTVDNCSTNDAMIRVLLEKLEAENLILHGTILHMRCAAHILNLIVQDGLSVIEGCIENIRESVLHWTSSPKRRQKFGDMVRQLHINSSLELVLDCRTRWNSTYLMLSIALIYKDVFFRLKHRDPSYTFLPSEEEWDLASEICSKLKKFHEATKAFSGTSYPTSNALFPLICEVKIDLREWVMTSNGTIRRMAEQMLIKFDRYWEVIEGPLAIAVVLDPRYKLKMVEWAFAIIYGDRARSELDKIKHLIHDLLDEYKRIEESSDISSSSVHPLGQGGSTFLSGFDSFVVDSTMSNQNGREELEKYLKESLLPRTQPFDILGWWKNQEVNYPTLRLIAKDILAIPVSTVVSESAFSTSGRLLRANRSTLDPVTIEALMCTQNWLRNEINGNGQIVITTLLALFLVVPFTLLFTLWIFAGEKGDSSEAFCLTRSIYDSDFLDNIDVIE
ncbi:Zinc finger BED domain-containing protein RICESLEEPER 1 [Linum grandiflorum]